MKATNTLKTMGLILAVGGLVGCQQVDRSFSTEEKIELASVTEDVPVTPVVNPTSPNVPALPVGTLPTIPPDKRWKIPAYCNAFIRPEPTIIDMTATNNVSVPGSGANQTIVKANTVTMSPTGGGGIEILSAITIMPFQATGGGTISVNAWTVKKVTMTGGSNICLHANLIEDVMTAGGGDQTLVANTVGVLEPGPGRIHLFGTTVKQLRRGQNPAKVCLYNGAKIENSGPYESGANLDEECFELKLK